MGLFDLFRPSGHRGGARQIRAGLEGAMAKRRLRGWQPRQENINSLLAPGGARLLARASANGDTAVAGLPKRPPPAIVAALTDGEDFELLFTVASRGAVPLLDAWKKKFPKLPLGCIGKISAEPGVRLRDEHGIRTLTEHGFVHFA